MYCLASYISCDVSPYSVSLFTLSLSNHLLFNISRVQYALVDWIEMAYLDKSANTWTCVTLNRTSIIIITSLPRWLFDAQELFLTFLAFLRSFALQGHSSQSQFQIQVSHGFRISRNALDWILLQKNSFPIAASVPLIQVDLLFTFFVHKHGADALML